MRYGSAADLSFPEGGVVDDPLLATPADYPGIPTDDCPVVTLMIAKLSYGNSPRLAGEDEEHVKLLAESSAELPPILVHRQTMRIIDGMHRVRAAVLRGENTIRARLFDGDDRSAFVLAVERNIRHGLPLTTEDRKSAATQIIASHPHWSDRAIAACTGLSDRTVRRIRQRSTTESPQSNGRVGQDGRVRPLSVVDGRLRASQIIAARPTVTLRTVARAAGISLGTAHDVRERMRRGDDPVPARQRAAEVRLATPAARQKPNRAVASCDVRVALEALRKDPSLKFTEAGRSILRWLTAHAIDEQDLAALVENMPPHCAEVVAGVARSTAESWQLFAAQLVDRASSMERSSAEEV